MELTAGLETDARPEVLFDLVDDLSRYPEWLDIVPRAVETPPDIDDPGPAWMVDLRARIGPMARSKRIRMVRDVSDAPTHVRFRRQEIDGRDHADWVLDATVEPLASGSRLTMQLEYHGHLWVPMLDKLLIREIEASRSRLRTLAET